MWLTNGEILILAFTFLVPGFVSQTIKSYFVPLKEKDTAITILGYLTFTGINYALWSWALYLVLFAIPPFDRPSIIIVLCFAVFIFSPLMLGILAGVLQSKGYIRKLMHKLKLEPMHESPSGWDWKFSKTDRPEIIHITLDNGTEIRGLFGAESFASDFSKDRDLYIEEIFDYQTDGNWSVDPNSKGLWVSGSSIKYIEFIRADIKEDENEKK